MRSHARLADYESAFTLSFQHFKESRSDRDFGDPFLYKTQEKVAAYTTAWDFEKKIQKAKLNYGIEYIFNKVGSRGRKTDIATGISQLDVSSNVSVLQHGTGEHTAYISVSGSYESNISLEQNSSTAQSYSLTQGCFTVGGCNVSVTQY